jgi:hypothetical protein
VDASPPNQFFRAEQGSVILEVYLINPTAERPAPGFGASDGIFGIFEENSVATNCTAYYRMGGPAINGIDYSNLPGSVSVTAADSGLAQLDLAPLADSSPQFTEVAVLTLIPTNTYLIDPTNASGIITIMEQSSNSYFQLVTASLPNPACIAYHPLRKNSLIVSYNSYTADASNFAGIDSSGNITGWTSISNLVDEVNLAIVQSSANGFTEGDMYFGTGTNGVIAWLSADGTVSNLDWLTLSGETNTLRGSFYLDQTGFFSNDLVVVTGDFFGNSGGDVWLVTSQTNAAYLTNIDSLHLEGLITLPDDTNRYGPWAGKILTGASAISTLYTIDTNVVVTPFQLGIACEDIHIIPTNQDFYLGDRENSLIYKLPRALLTNYAGDLLITQEEGSGSMLFIVYWDTNSASFFQRQIPAPGDALGGPVFNPPDFEQGTFAPIDIPASPLPYY